MDLGLEGKGAVVLASTAGLGLASASALLDEGASVAISGRDRSRLDAALEKLRARHGERAWGEALDVTDHAAVRRHLEAARARFRSVDVLVTNSGGPRPSAAAATTLDDLEAGHALIVRSAIQAIGVVLPWMRERRFGRILALTSSSARQPVPGLALSNTYRAALTGYLKTLSAEVARDGVLVNSVCTGYFDTDRLVELFAARAAKSGRTAADERALVERDLPIGRIGALEEFGAAIAFLASPRASYVTGVALPLDGGLTRSLL